MFSHWFLTIYLQEGQNNTINLPDDDVLAVHCMIRYFYFLDYDPEDQSEEDGFETQDAPSFATQAESKAALIHGKPEAPQSALKPHHALKLHAEVYVLADRYDVAALKNLALDKFKRALRSHWDGDGFVAAAHTAYEWTSEADVGLRASVLDAMFEHRLKLLNDPRLKEHLEGLGSLMYSLASRMIAPTSVQLKRCDSCSRIFS